MNGKAPPKCARSAERTLSTFRPTHHHRAARHKMNYSHPDAETSIASHNEKQAILRNDAALSPVDFACPGVSCPVMPHRWKFIVAATVTIHDEAFSAYQSYSEISHSFMPMVADEKATMVQHTCFLWIVFTTIHTLWAAGRLWGACGGRGGSVVHAQNVGIILNTQSQVIRGNEYFPAARDCFSHELLVSVLLTSL